MDYKEFLETKKHTIGEFGFEPNYIPSIAFDFQQFIIEKAIKKGRMAIFADTGLGKTLIQLSIAKNIINHTNKKVLILTPLAVAFQFIIEAEKLGIDDIEYSKDGKHTKKIVICNYERLHYFDPADFVGVILDESSILKNFDGKIKGQITAVHCTDVFDNTCRLWDFPHEIIRLHEKYGFEYRNRITIWKEPLKVRMRTMVQSLMHKFIVEDTTKCFTAMPDYVLIFTKKGENQVPVTHEFGLNEYFGETPILPNILRAYNNANGTDFNESQLWHHLNTKYKNHPDPKSNKLSHYIWQRYASSVWDDIRIDNVLPFRDSKEEDDEKHVHPLQLDVIDRIVELYSNPNEVVLTPFMGVGSEVYSPVSLGRKAIGIELKDSYFKQATINLKLAKERFNKTEQVTLL